MSSIKNISIKTRKALELMADGEFVQAFNEDVAFNRTCERYMLLDLPRPVNFKFWHEMNLRERFKVAYAKIRKQIKEMLSEIEVYCG